MGNEAGIEGGWNREAIQPVQKVTVVPMSTYQVNAIGVSNRTYRTAARPAATPTIAAHSRGREVSTPSRKTPSNAPAGIDPIAQ